MSPVGTGATPSVPTTTRMDNRYLDWAFDTWLLYVITDEDHFVIYSLNH